MHSFYRFLFCVFFFYCTIVWFNSFYSCLLEQLSLCCDKWDDDCNGARWRTRVQYGDWLYLINKAMIFLFLFAFLFYWLWVNKMTLALTWLLLNLYFLHFLKAAFHFIFIFYVYSNSDQALRKDVQNWTNIIMH